MSARTILSPTERAPTSAAPVLRAAGVTHPGNEREVNEDAFFIGERVCAVADGMGGHAAGEVASGLVVEWCAALDDDPVGDLPALADRLAELNRSVRTAARNDLEGMGTTVVGVAIVPNGGAESAVVFNVGDSRCYTLTHSGFSQVTVDHSHVQELIESGALLESEASTHPMRHVVTRALGADRDVAVDFHVLDDIDCRLVLCSDGVSGELESEEIARQAGAFEAPRAAAQRILDRTLIERAMDNVTAVIVDVEFPSTSGDDRSDRTAPVDTTAERGVSPWAPPESVASGHTLMRTPVASAAVTSEVRM